jgi:D-alanyl-lipoteichoic acid acyltransferase DltB (MBOAT superfamily)
MSLSSWFKDYVFLPARSALTHRIGRPRVLGVDTAYLTYAAAVAITFLLSGLWHGANWTFVAWGALNGGYLILSRPTRRVRARMKAALGIDRHPVADAIVRTATTFALITFSWIFFRSRSLHEAMQICQRLPFGWGALLTRSGFTAAFAGVGLTVAAVGVAGVILVESVQAVEHRANLPALLNAQPWWMRWGVYYAAVASIYFLYANEGQFIYFQF